MASHEIGRLTTSLSPTPSMANNQQRYIVMNSDTNSQVCIPTLIKQCLTLPTREIATLTATTGTVRIRITIQIGSYPLLLFLNSVFMRSICRDDSYYYQNPDGSKYHHDGRGYEQYTPRDERYHPQDSEEYPDVNSVSDEETQESVPSGSDRDHASWHEGDVNTYSDQQADATSREDHFPLKSERDCDIRSSDASHSGDHDRPATSYDSDQINSSYHDEGGYSDLNYGDANADCDKSD